VCKGWGKQRHGPWLRRRTTDSTVSPIACQGGSSMSRALYCCGLSAAVLFCFGTVAEAGLFGHRQQAGAGCCEPTCGIEPTCGCEPICGIEPTCGCEPICGIEPTCGCEPSCGCAPACGAPCIKYRHKHAHCHGCNSGCCEPATYQTVLHATSPETCRTVCVPVCLPCCCQGCPCESSRCTLFGCGQVRYDYGCGCSVIVRFQRCGDILVTYVGF